MAIVQVALPVPLHQLFDYRIDDGPLPQPGSRVDVPFGRGQRVGIVVATAPASDVGAERIKRLNAVLDDQPLFDAELLATLQWAARYYQHPLGEVLVTALPVALRMPRPLPQPGEPALQLTDGGRERVAQPGRTTRIATLLARLRESPIAHTDLDVELPGWRGSAATLRKRGDVVDVRIAPPPRAAEPIAGPALNDEQHTAVDAVESTRGRFAPFLLDGVTGSGKTEVYLRLIAAALARGEQSLVLLPEIALTPQMLRRFRERLGIDVAALHSGLADGERAAAWLAAARGDAKVILGTRSAVFTPLAKPGLIVVDEEHDTSYKQHEGFRYHARDLAVVRARALGVPIVLGSATPSLESLANVEAGRYRLLRLDRRAGVARPPTVRIIDLRRQRHEHGLAPDTLRAIRACLDRGEQALLFRNRRGYAPSLHCPDCGWVALCERCDRPYTLHRQYRRLVCHHCEATRPLPSACPDCSGDALAPVGRGTERIEESLALLFPDVPVIRIDRDTTRSRENRDRLFAALDQDGPQLLVGTQMLAKGHDLARLTLVVVVSVDEALYGSDFRASERMGQLLVQVSGRSGRADKPGEVWLQTHQPAHPLFAALLGGGYRALATTLLAERRAASWPPFAQLALLRVDATDPAPMQAFLDAAVATQGDAQRHIIVHALSAPMPRRAGHHRGQVLVEAVDRASLQQFLPAWLDALRKLPQARKVRWSIDVDPVDLF